ncbi:MAG: type II toxin-antitoxin system HicB family antitoxin [bacterium]
MKYPVVVHKSEYGYDVHCPLLPGCHSQGDTMEEALENIQDAIVTYLQMVADEVKGSIYEVEVKSNALYRSVV